MSTVDLSGEPSGTRPLTEDSKGFLKRAAGNVRHLISHIANEGLPVEEKDYEELLAALPDVDKLNPQQEAAFWKSYSALVKNALPARVEALAAVNLAETGQKSTDPQIVRIQRQKNAIKKIRLVSIAAFLVTIVLFAYLSVSESLLQRNRAIADEYLNLQANITRGTAIEAQVKAVDEGKSPASGAGGGAETSKPDYAPTAPDIIRAGLIDNRKQELQDLASYNDKFLRSLQFGLSSDDKKKQRAISPVDGSVLVSQQAINALISKYLLPIFAAILGVTVFILRSVSAEIKSLSFRTNDFSIYSNRLALGVVGGIAISWFAVTDTTGVVGSITPAALAFLVGYSVEVLYNVLDSLVKALGANEKA